VTEDEKAVALWAKQLANEISRESIREQRSSSSQSAWRSTAIGRSAWTG
jgi:hypothetical protein